MTDSMRRAIDETNRRRAIQEAYNEANGITPQSIIKPIDMSLIAIAEGDYVTVPVDPPAETEQMTAEELAGHLAALEAQMREAAKKFEFEKAAQLRDRIKALKNRSLYEEPAPSGVAGRRAS